MNEWRNELEEKTCAISKGDAMSKYQEIKNRVEKSTPGPWKWTEDEESLQSPKRRIYKTIEESTGYASSRYYGDCEIEDAEFIANARTDVPLLLKALGDVCEALANVSDLSPFIPEALDPDYWLGQAMESEK